MVKPLLLVALFLGPAVPRPADPIMEASAAFLGSLSEPQRRTTLLAYEDEARFDWHYVPRARRGAHWGRFDDKQKSAAVALLRASLSQAGYEKIEQIRQLEVLLRQMENNPGRDVERYFFLFFGSPSKTQPWAWRYEGHHLSLTFAFREGKLVASTPQFLGTNPARSAQSEPLKKERDLAFKLLASLTDEQRKVAILSERAPGDILTTNRRRAAIEGRQGLPARSLTSGQRQMLVDLVSAHAEVQSKAEQDRRLKAFALEVPAELVFAWMGPAQPNRRHYYRIQGRDLLIEYDNTQDDGNHIHTVWRNLREDFGGDPLEAHYRHGHDHP